MMKDKHYDVGVFGVWMGCNYGSVATYYALHEILKDLGKSVLMIDKPKSDNSDVELSMTHSRRFALEHYEISPSYKADEFYKLNELCDSFVIGSDQVWNYGISKHTGYLMYLDFAADDKLKISYASSLGHSVDFAPDEERKKIAKLLSKFDGISVREKSGVKLLNECYGINSTQVLDPVFLPDPAVFENLANKSSHRENEPFLATYVLDPTPEKRQVILHTAEKLGGIKVVNLMDGLPWTFKKNVELLNLPNCVENLQVEDWLYYISKCEFLITDSCHGASFAIIFRRRFVAISNKRRGHTRFVSLLDNFNLANCLVTSPLNLLNDDSYLEEYNKDMVDRIMAEKCRTSLGWLKDIFKQSKKNAGELIRQNVIKDISLTDSGSKNIVAVKKDGDLQNPEAPLEFVFDKEDWESHVILGYTTMIPLKANPESKKYAYVMLDTGRLEDKKILAQKSYRISLDLRYHTSSAWINIHLYSSVKNKLQIIHRLKTAKNSMNRWIPINLTFTANSDDYDSLMIGAMQISGENRFIAFRNIIVSN